MRRHRLHGRHGVFREGGVRGGTGGGGGSCGQGFQHSVLSHCLLHAFGDGVHEAVESAEFSAGRPGAGKVMSRG